MSKAKKGSGVPAPKAFDPESANSGSKAREEQSTVALLATLLSGERAETLSEKEQAQIFEQLERSLGEAHQQNQEMLKTQLYAILTQLDSHLSIIPNKVSAKLYDLLTKQINLFNEENDQIKLKTRLAQRFGLRPGQLS